MENSIGKFRWDICVSVPYTAGVHNSGVSIKRCSTVVYFVIVKICLGLQLTLHREFTSLMKGSNAASNPYFSKLGVVTHATS